jgi:hypothetical protein
MKEPGRKPRKRRVTGAASKGMRPVAEPHVTRKRMSVISLTVPADDVHYWRSQSASARLAYMEYLRLINYGQAATSGRLKRVFEITQLRPR